MGIDWLKQRRQTHRRKFNVRSSIAPLAINDDPAPNRISNAKYTLVNFIPYALAQQLSRFLNVYFILIAVLELFPTITPVNPLTTWVPLIIVFAASMTKEALDDYKRHQRDRIANQTKSVILRDGRETIVCAEDIQLGDIVVVEPTESFPCDVILLRSELTDASANDSDGLCMVQTANLDGETDLKPRRCIPLTNTLSPSAFHSLSATLDIPPPDPQVYVFHGLLHSNESSATTVLTADSMGLQGTHLAQSATVARVFGVAVYLGNETKIGMNKPETRTKYTQIDSAIEYLSRSIFALQFSLMIIFGAFGIRNLSVFQSVFYLQNNPRSLTDSLVIPLRFLLLMSFMIPISLKVTLDIAKGYYAKLIEWDLNMFHSDAPVTANNTAIAEDLGAIECVLTDKTGTLTANEMVLERLSVCASRSQVNVIESGAALADTDERLLSALATCHTVDVRVKEDGEREYVAASPDELAMVEALAARTEDVWVLHEHTPTRVVVSGGRAWTLLASVAFTSARRRMAVVVCTDAGEIVVYVKGGDDAVLERCVDAEERAWGLDEADAHSQLGLRTLCVAQRTVERPWMDAWLARLADANALVDAEERERALDECHGELECDLRLLGVTAVRDRLQTGVPDTVRQLRMAKVRVWMLTGDRRDTAVRISVSAGLCDGLDCTTVIHVHAIADVDDERRAMVEHEQRVANCVSGHIPYMVVADGGALMLMMRQEMRGRFLALCRSAMSVIACRVTPLQKADVVTMVRSEGWRTLAIGDGGNDVAMIQQAHVGVGIAGKEGLQAARAADYSFARFRFLSRLMFVHGRYSFNRTAFIGLFCFHKSIYLALMQILFATVNGASGSSLFDSLSLTCYNVIFTALPIFAYVLDKDISIDAAERSPSMYAEDTRWRTRGLSLSRCLLWIFRAFYQSAITFCFAVLLLSPNDYATAAMAAYVVAIFVQTLNVALEFHEFSRLSAFAVAVQIPLFFVVFSASVALPHVSSGYTLFQLCAQSAFWFYLLITVCVCELPFVVFSLLQQPQQQQTQQPASVPSGSLNPLTLHDRNSDTDSDEEALLNDNGDSSLRLHTLSLPHDSFSPDLTRERDTAPLLH